MPDPDSESLAVFSKLEHVHTLVNELASLDLSPDAQAKIVLLRQALGELGTDIANLSAEAARYSFTAQLATMQAQATRVALNEEVRGSTDLLRAMLHSR